MLIQILKLSCIALFINIKSLLKDLDQAIRIPKMSLITRFISKM